MNTSLLFTEYCPAFTIYDCWFVFFRKNYKTVAVCSDKNYNEHYAILLSHISNLILYANIKYLPAQVKKEKKKKDVKITVDFTCGFILWECKIRSSTLHFGIHCDFVWLYSELNTSVYLLNTVLYALYYILCFENIMKLCIVYAAINISFSSLQHAVINISIISMPIVVAWQLTSILHF